MIFLTIILIFLLGFGFYNLYLCCRVMPSRGAVKNLNHYSEDTSILEDLKDFLVSPTARIISRFIKIDMYKRERLRRDLIRAGYTVTPEEYYAEAITITAYIGIVGIILFFTLSKFFGVLGIILAVIMYFSRIDKVNDKLGDKSAKILREMPRFIRTYNNSRSQNPELIDIMEKYRKVAGDAFKYDLDVLITDLKTMGSEESLRRFEQRINIPHMSQFVNALISAQKGEDQGYFFDTLGHEMTVLARENIQRELDKRPEKVHRITMMLAVLLFAVLMYPIGLELINGLALFG
ncbi:MAG: hypothetical protein PUF72_05615 [Clostridiales bacterium]|nr:hypothetical protein [Clostridiales bacterium]